MASINILGSDMAAARRIAEIIRHVENNEEDFAFANTVTDELYLYQPFILSMMMGYKMDLTPGELSGVIKLFIVIWEYNKVNSGVRSTPISQERYERVEDRNISVLKNIERSGSDKDRPDYLIEDLNRSDSKALLAALFMQFKENESLRNMAIQTKGPLLIGLKSVIECFDEVSAGIQK